MVSVTRRKKHRRVGVNERGRPVGETHPLAKLSDADIELIHELREAGLSYAAIAAKFDDGVTVSKSHVRHIVNGHRRGQMPVRYRVKACT